MFPEVRNLFGVVTLAPLGFVATVERCTKIVPEHPERRSAAFVTVDLSRLHYTVIIVRIVEFPVS